MIQIFAPNIKTNKGMESSILHSIYFIAPVHEFFDNSSYIDVAF